MNDKKKSSLIYSFNPDNSIISLIFVSCPKTTNNMKGRESNMKGK